MGQAACASPQTLQRHRACAGLRGDWVLHGAACKVIPCLGTLVLGLMQPLQPAVQQLDLALVPPMHLVLL